MNDKKKSSSSSSSSSCSCNDCKDACLHRPGWFKSGEPERVAEYLGISLQELFSKKLMIDWWWTKNPFLPAEASLEEEEAEKGKPPRPIFLISPAIDTGKPGQEYPANPHGMCAFYDPEQQRCTIHAVKPFECREYMHYDTERDVRLRQKEVALTWKDNNDEKSKEQIKKLLGGREPQVSFPNIEEIINNNNQK